MKKLTSSSEETEEQDKCFKTMYSAGRLHQIQEIDGSRRFQTSVEAKS